MKEVTERYLLTMTLWREARGEPDDVKAAVCYSMLRRVQLGGWWGDTIEKVVTAKWQYSSMTDPHDPQLVKYLISTDPSAAACWDVMEKCRAGVAPNKFPTADSYHDKSIAPPPWATAPTTTHLGELGRIHFYKTRS